MALFGKVGQVLTRLISGDGSTLIGNQSTSLNAIDFANVSGVQAALIVGTSATLLKVGASALVNRRYVTFQPKDTGVFWGYTSGVTTATGTEVFKDQYITLPCGAGVTVYLIATSASKNVRIGELS